MKIIVTKEAFLKGMQRIQNVVSNRTTPILSNTLIEATERGVRLTTTDLDLGIRCDVEAKVERTGGTTLPAKRLAAIVRELPEADIVIETDAKNLTTLRCANTSYKIMGLPKEEFPPFPAFTDAKTYTIGQDTLRDGLRKTNYAISPDETRRVLNGICFIFEENKFTLVATDGRRLALFDRDMELPQKMDRSFIIPTKAINELLRLLEGNEPLKIAASDNLAVFRMPGIELASKLVEGKYPNYKQVIPGDAKERVTIEREQFLAETRRVALCAQEKGGSLRLTLEPGEMKIYASSPEGGESEGSIPVKYEGRKMVISFNPDFLIDPLKALNEEEVHLNLIDEISPGTISIDSPFIYVLMPIRLSV